MYKSNQTKEAITKLGFVQMEHPSYNSDLVPINFWLFNHQKKDFQDRKLEPRKELKSDVYKFEMEIDFFKIGLETMVDRWRSAWP